MMTPKERKESEEQFWKKMDVIVGELRKQELVIQKSPKRDYTNLTHTTEQKLPHIHEKRKVVGRDD